MRKPSLSRPADGAPRAIVRLLGRWAIGVALTCVILVPLVTLLIVSAPVSIFTQYFDRTPAVVAVYGSLGQGRVELAGGYRLSWTSQARVFWLPHLATDFTLVGNDTLVSGTAQSGVRGVVLQNISGRAGPGLAQLVQRAWACDMTANLADVAIVWGWRRASASGAITTPAGACVDNGRTIAMPPFRLSLSGEGNDAVFSLTAAEPEPLATVRISRDRLLDIVIEPVAADVFPALPRGGPITLQLPF